MINFVSFLPVFVDNGTFVVDVEILVFCDETTGIDDDDNDDDGRGGGVGGGGGRWGVVVAEVFLCCWTCDVVWGFCDIHCSIVFGLTFCWIYVSRNSGCSPR